MYTTLSYSVVLNKISPKIDSLVTEFTVTMIWIASVSGRGEMRNVDVNLKNVEKRRKPKSYGDCEIWKRKKRKRENVRRRRVEKGMSAAAQMRV